MTLTEELREQWTEARRVMQRQLAALERGHLGGAFGPEHRSELAKQFGLGAALRTAGKG